MVAICYTPTVVNSSGQIHVPLQALLLSDILNLAHLCPPHFYLLLYPGPLWREAWSFWLPGAADSPQRHPQANTWEKRGGGEPQRRPFRLRHQLLRDRPRQPGQLPALTPCTLLDSKPGQELKTKGSFFVMFALEEQNHRRECYAHVKVWWVQGSSLESSFCCLNVSERKELVVPSW